MPSGMRPYGTTTYQYRSGDDPLKVAQQFNLHPNQLQDANPGGFPPVPGQVINIPRGPQNFQQQFSSAWSNFLGNTPAYLQQNRGTYGQTSNTTLPAMPTYLRPRGAFGQTISPTPYNNPVMGVNGQPLTPHGTFGQTNPAFLAGSTQTGSITTVPTTYPTPLSVTRGTAHPTGLYTTLVSRLQANPAEYDQLPPQMQKVVDGILESANQNQGGGQGNTDFMKTKFMQEYQAKGTGFYDQKRWDPTANHGQGGYTKIGDLLRQGKLDIHTGKTTWRGYNHRGGGGRGRYKNAPARLTSVGVVDFNASSG